MSVFALHMTILLRGGIRIRTMNNCARLGKKSEKFRVFILHGIICSKSFDSTRKLSFNESSKGRINLI